MTSEPPNRDGELDSRPSGGANNALNTTEPASTDPPGRSSESLVNELGAVPKRIGQYHLKRIIATGGMGTVFEATQEKPRRTVALKLMKSGIASRSALRRFEYEAQILARLRHPGIAQIFEAGTHRSDTETVPYFAMEYIPNAKPITEYADAKKLATRERLEMFSKVCDAVHHGHQKGIIHRDLKPGNILIDSHGSPRVIDFGVARATDSDLAVTTLQTDVGQLIGTIQYMSPEQCEADPHDLDTRSDVYSLGVVLYQLLCRRLPYDVGKISIYEASRIIREHTPTSLSTIDRDLRGDLETIVFKALEKDRERRYRSAAELADDVNRYLSGEGISARPPSIVYQLRLFTRRNKALFGAMAAIFIVLAGASIFSTYQYVQAENARKSAVLAREDAERQRFRAENERDLAKDAERRAQRPNYYTYIANIAAAEAALSMNQFAKLNRRLDAAPREHRNWEWRYLRARSDPSLATLRGHEGPVTSVAYSPDGSRLASASTDRTVRVWDVASGEEVAVCRGHEDTVSWVAFSPDGRRLATASHDHTIRIWNAFTGEELSVLSPNTTTVRFVAFDRDGRRLVSIDDVNIRIWDVSSGKQLQIFYDHGSRVLSAEFSTDGVLLVSRSRFGNVRVWNPVTGKDVAVLKAQSDDFNCAAVSPDGKSVAAASRVRRWQRNDEPPTLYVWDLATGMTKHQLAGHRGVFSSVVFSSDSTRLAAASTDGTVRIWNLADGQELAVLRGHEYAVRDLKFSPNGSHLASASTDKTVRIWDASTVAGPVTLTREGIRGVSSVAFSPCGTRLVCGFFDSAVRIWDVSAREELAVLRGHERGVRFVAASPDGSRIASASDDGTVRLWDAATGANLFVLRGHNNIVWSVAFSPDGRHIASGSDNKPIRIWDVSTGEQLAILVGHKAGVHSLAFNAKGTLLASSDLNTVRVWDTSSWKELPVLGRRTKDVSSVVFSPDGTSLALNTDNSRDLAGPRLPDAWYKFVAFTPDGSRLASPYNGGVHLWDALTSEELIVLRRGGSFANQLAFSPDGARLAMVSHREPLLIWDSEPYRTRYDERETILAAYPEAGRLVDGLRRNLKDWNTVAERISDDETLSDPVRHAALNVVLRRATNHP